MNKINEYSLRVWVILLTSMLISFQVKAYQNVKPNVLWITIEDLSPMLGCYGDTLAVTPNIDRLAQLGTTYTNAFSTAAVCSPARSALLTGIYASTLGTQHLRSETEVPNTIKTYPELLRNEGYYCTNNGKEDYNFDPGDVWDESSDNAHWRNKTNKDKPFFSVFNFMATHQSQIFGDEKTYQDRFEKYLPLITRTDPSEINLPPYFFDSPKIRQLWARYYDNVKIVDLQIKELLVQLEEDSLMDNTIIFFYSDHGTGMPRGKRALYDSGLRVPLIVVAPEKYQDLYGLPPGNTTERLVSFVDFAPTVLNLLDIEVPSYMQGIPFLGKDSQKEREYVFATADRVDEAYEAVRSIRSKKFRYVRNFLPHLPLIQPNFYSDQSEIMQEVYKVKSLKEDLTSAQKSMWTSQRQVEELYDLTKDPYEINNLATDTSYSSILKNLQKQAKNVMVQTYDSALAPEAYLYHISENSTPFDALKSESLYPMENILGLLETMYDSEPEIEDIEKNLNNTNPLIPYWTMIALQYKSELGDEIKGLLLKKLKSQSELVRLTAAETLCKYGHSSVSVFSVLLVSLKSQNPYIQLMSARAIELLDQKVVPIRGKVKDEWIRLKESTKGKWMGYDLYAFWSLSQHFKK